MPKIKLTDNFCKTAKPQIKLLEYWDIKTQGLCFRITPGGSKSWSIRYRDLTNKQVRLSLGRYPAVGLADARTRAFEVFASIGDGQDPAKERRHAKLAALEEAQAEKLRTIQGLGEDYFRAAKEGRHRKNSSSARGKPKVKAASSLRLERGYFDRLVLPKFGKTPITDLRRFHIQKYVDELQDNQSTAAAVQCLKILRQIYNYADFLDVVDQKNPCQNVIVREYESRTRVLSHQELQKIWIASERYEELGFSISFSLAMKLCALTLQRRGEVAGMCVEELDLSAKTWLIPAQRRKNREEHIVPLSNQALTVIREALDTRKGKNSKFIFPSTRGNVDQPISRDNLSAFFRAVKQDITNARLHDLRRTGATNLTSERIGIPRHTVSMVLGHSSDVGGSIATKIYDLNTYLPQKRRALDAWAALLEEIVDGSQVPDNVLTLEQKR